MKHENATLRRIVACLDACEGMPTKALEDGALQEVVDYVSMNLGALADWEVRADPTLTALDRAFRKLKQ